MTCCISGAGSVSYCVMMGSSFGGATEGGVSIARSCIFYGRFSSSFDPRPPPRTPARGGVLIAPLLQTRATQTLDESRVSVAAAYSRSRGVTSLASWRRWRARVVAVLSVNRRTGALRVVQLLQRDPPSRRVEGFDPAIVGVAGVGKSWLAVRADARPRGIPRLELDRMLEHRWREGHGHVP